MPIEVLTLVYSLVQAGASGYQDGQYKHHSHSRLPGLAPPLDIHVQ
jgi:hypothetical protein